MTLTELRYILAISQTKHFGRAAELCFVSQPTLSVAIKKIEDELGISLFERSKNEIHITEIGEKIIAQAQKVLEEVETIHHLAAQGKNQLNSTLKIGAIHTVGPYLFPQLIPQICVKN